jgi:hypothetical protein
MDKCQNTNYLKAIDCFLGLVYCCFDLYKRLLVGKLVIEGECCTSWRLC